MSDLLLISALSVLAICGYGVDYLSGVKHLRRAMDEAYQMGVRHGVAQIAGDPTKIWTTKELNSTYRVGFADGRQSAIGYESMEKFKELEERFPRLKG
jgi:hypothetical protein